MKYILTTLLATTALFATAASHANCSNPSGVEGDVIYNSTAKNLQFCDGTVWVNAAGVAPSSGGGGGSSATYAGLTTSTYTGGGNSGHLGLKGMNELCAADFAGSRMMRYSDYLNIASDISGVSSVAWVYCDLAGCALPGTSNGGLSANCYDGGTTGGKGATYDYTTQSISYANCTSTYKIACVTD